MPRELEDGTPLATIQQILFDESQSQSRAPRAPAPLSPVIPPIPPIPKNQPRVTFEEPIPTAVHAMSDVDPMDVIQQSANRVSSFGNAPPPHELRSAARQFMNAVIVTFVVFVALYIFPFLQSTPTEYRASTMKILIIAVAMGIAVLYIQKSLR